MSGGLASRQRAAGVRPQLRSFGVLGERTDLRGGVMAPAINQSSTFCLHFPVGTEQGPSWVDEKSTGPALGSGHEGRVPGVFPVMRV